MCILKDAFSVNDKNKIVHINNSFPTSMHQCSDTQYQDNSNYQRYSPSSFFNNVQKYTDIDWNYDYSPEWTKTLNYNPQSNNMNKWVGTVAGRAIGFGPMMDYQNQRRGNLPGMPGMPRCFEPDDAFDPYNQYQAPRRPFRCGRRPIPGYYDPYDDDDDDEAFTPWGEDDDDDPLIWGNYYQPGWAGGGYTPNYYQPQNMWQMPPTFGQGFPGQRGRRRNPFWPYGPNY